MNDALVFIAGALVGWLSFLAQLLWLAGKVLRRIGRIA